MNQRFEDAEVEDDIDNDEIEIGEDDDLDDKISVNEGQI
jgi:hypothetical protein